ncbi:MAG: hypothetical protein DRI44_05700 [Chlamydiae bacterium]|nr:MAG: hypothetical protein DRI44_05700 [Chlamydiota bacterium]
MSETEKKDKKENDVRRCLNCGRELFVTPRSKRKFCNNKCAREYRTKLTKEEEEREQEPILEKELDEVPPKDYLRVKVNSDRRKEPLQLLFICNSCIINRYNPATKQLSIPEHQLLGTYYGECPICGKKNPFNPEVSPNIRVFVKIPPREEPRLDENDLIACKKIYKYYAKKARENT